jgi:putative sugar O-methyltransferase
MKNSDQSKGFAADKRLRGNITFVGMNSPGATRINRVETGSSAAQGHGCGVYGKDGGESSSSHAAQIIAGLDPAIHPLRQNRSSKKMDARVEPAHGRPRVDEAWYDTPVMTTKVIKSLVRRAAGALGYRIERIPPAVDFRLRSRRDRGADDPVARAAKAHLAAAAPAPDQPSLGERWGAYATQLRDRIDLLSSAQDIILFGQSPAAGVETHLPVSELLGFCHWQELQLLSDRLPGPLYDALSSFRAPRVIRPDCVVEYRGRRIDFVTQCSAVVILTILNLLKDQWPRSVCDIGGGTGTYARSWLTNSAHRPELVAIVDLPETLVYSETLLKSELGDARVQYISSPSATANKSGIVLYPLANIPALETVSFDLVTNIGSMQEMSDDWIDWYMAWLDRQPCRYFYSLNFFANALTNMREGHNSWSPRPSPRWQLVHSKISLGLRNHAELLFRKDGPEPARTNETAAAGVDAWLAHLEAARRHGDEAALRRALEFAHTQMPFIPKETWEVAKRLAALTGSTADREAFAQLDQMRRAGNEAAH